MPDTQTYIQRLADTNPLIKPVIRSAIQALQLPRGSRGLDAGCGIGLQAVLLANAVGPAGQVNGLDLAFELLLHAREVARKSGFSGQVSFQEGDVGKLPFKDDTFDWAWSANCVGYAPMEPLPLVKELARAVKPGGRIVIIAWSSEKLLPGYPLLEARLNATSSGIAPFVRGMGPEFHFSRALGWLHEAGLEEPTAQTFAGGAYAPLSDGLHSSLVALFQMRWKGVESELTPEDRAEYQRLCLPESPDFILNHRDYYGLFTYSMFCGKVPE
jgi:demethylmenaquinone methyltransferase/2-methoxy-6-polyprenyl-1,4-benzoquinol methylase